METISTSTTPIASDPDDYGPMLDAVRNHFAGAIAPGVPLFTTDAADPWLAFLEALPADQRKHHTCHACRRFVERYGSIVMIDAEGKTTPAIFSDAAPGFYGEAFAAVAKLVRRARVTGVFFSEEAVWGMPQNKATNNPTGFWRHMSVAPPKEMIFRGKLKNASQTAAEKAEEYAMLCRGLADFDADAIARALAMVEAEALFRAEKVAGHLKWIGELHAKRAALRGPARDNVAWLAVALAPAGWCHIRTSMSGTLLEDVVAGLPFEDIKRKFGEKMNPLQYRRPTAAPTVGAIKQAEETVAKLGIARSLLRRFARIEDLRPLWTPPAEQPPAEGGVFSHLLPGAKKPGAGSVIKGATMTWEKFTKTVPIAEIAKIEVAVPAYGHFLAFVAAVDPEAPPILQWDREGARNTVSWYVYPSPKGTPASRWNLRSGAWVPVTAIARFPYQWPDTVAAGALSHFGDGVVFVLEGCRDLAPHGGAGLFPEILKAELHAVQSVIEAYSNKAPIAEPEHATACGLEVRAGSKTAPVQLRVTARSGIITEYAIDRME